MSNCDTLAESNVDRSPCHRTFTSLLRVAPDSVKSVLNRKKEAIGEMSYSHTPVRRCIASLVIDLITYNVTANSYWLLWRVKQTVGHMKSRLSIFYSLLVAFSTMVFSSCVTTQPSGASTEKLQQLAAQAALYNAATPVQDVLVWTIGPDGALSTHWVRGNHASGTIVASRSGLLLPTRSGLWELGEVEVEVPLCDCELWTKRKRTGECPPAEEVAYANLPRMNDLITDSEVELVPRPAAQAEKSLLDSQFSSTVSVTGSVGPFLFISQSVERVTCGSGHVSSKSTFLVFDVESRQPVTLFEPDERQRMLENEQTVAYEQFRSDPNIRIKSPDDLQLTRIEVGLVPGVGLTLGYQFTARASFADSKGNRSEYVRSTTIAVKKLPRALIPYAEFPSGLQRFVVLDEGIRIGGWVPITNEGIARLRSKNAFDLLK